MVWKPKRITYILRGSLATFAAIARRSEHTLTPLTRCKHALNSETISHGLSTSIRWRDSIDGSG